MQTRLPEATRVSVRRVYALINPTSGGVGSATAEELTALFAELGLDHYVSELIPGQFEHGVRAAIDANSDLIVVLGGDGTARLVAERCGPRGPLVAPLSGGTMNKLGRALYGAKSWREALVSVLAQGEARWMPGGEVGGRMFYCSAVLGAPAQWALAREAFRAHMLSRAGRCLFFATQRQLSCITRSTTRSGAAWPSGSSVRRSRARWAMTKALSKRRCSICATRERPFA